MKALGFHISDEQHERRSCAGRAARVAAAFAACLFGLWFLLVNYRFEGGAGFSLHLKGVSAILGVLVALAVMVVAQRAPHLLAGPWWTRCCVAANIAGLLGVSLGMAGGGEAMLLVGYLFGTMGLVWAFCLTAVAAATLGTHGRIAALSVGFLARCLLVCGASFLSPRESLVVALAAASFVTAASVVMAREAGSFFDLLGSARGLREVAAEHPRSFLPFSNKLFAMVSLLACLYGFSDTAHGWLGLDADVILGNAVSATALSAMFLLHRGKPGIDQLFYTALVLAVAGFVVGPIWSESGSMLYAEGTAVLVAGSDLFVLFVYALIFELAARNLLALIPLTAFATLAYNLGFAVDAALWGLSYAIPGNAIAVAFFLFFVVYAFLFLRGYSFEGAVQSVAPLEVSANAPVDRTFQDRCDAVAERYRLTTRERDIFNLMARGRNSRYIQRELVVSQNTVKTHTRNIYGKLGVHSRQELIDLIEK